MPAAPPLPHAGVRFPPPFLYVLGFAAGWLLDREWPFPMTAGASPIRSLIAAVCFVVWLVFMLGAFATFRRARTTIIPNRPAAALVTDGPYRVTRNPMYVSLVALYLGLALAIDTWWPVLLLPAVVFAIHRLVIVPEEQYLAGAFPAEYQVYRRRVRRWL